MNAAGGSASLEQTCCGFSLTVSAFPREPAAFSPAGIAAHGPDDLRGQLAQAEGQAQGAAQQANADEGDFLPVHGRTVGEARGGMEAIKGVGRALPRTAPVAQVSKPAVSPISKSAAAPGFRARMTSPDAAGDRTDSGFSTPRYSRFGNLRYAGRVRGHAAAGAETSPGLAGGPPALVRLRAHWNSRVRVSVWLTLKASS